MHSFPATVLACCFSVILSTSVSTQSRLDFGRYLLMVDTFNSQLVIVDGPNHTIVDQIALSPTNRIVSSPSGRYVYSMGGNGTGTYPWTLSKHDVTLNPPATVLQRTYPNNAITGGLHDLAVSPDGATLAFSTSMFGNLYIVNANDLAIQHEVRLCTDCGTPVMPGTTSSCAISFTADSQRIIAGVATQNVVATVDVATGTPLLTQPAHSFFGDPSYWTDIYGIPGVPGFHILSNQGLGSRLYATDYPGSLPLVGEEFRGVQTMDLFNVGGEIYALYGGPIYNNPTPPPAPGKRVHLTNLSVGASYHFNTSMDPVLDPGLNAHDVRMSFDTGEIWHVENRGPLNSRVRVTNFFTDTVTAIIDTGQQFENFYGGAEMSNDGRFYYVAEPYNGAGMTAVYDTRTRALVTRLATGPIFQIVCQGQTETREI